MKYRCCLRQLIEIIAILLMTAYNGVSSENSLLQMIQANNSLSGANQ